MGQFDDIFGVKTPDDSGVAVSGEYDDIFGIKPQRTLKTNLQDVAATAAKGITGLSDAAIGLANIPTMGQAGRAAQLVGLNEVYDDPMQAEQALQEHQQNIAAGKRNEFLDASPYSAPQQFAQKQVTDAEGVLGKLGAAVRNPSTIATAVGESVPSMLAGGLIGRGLAVGTKLSPVVAGAIGEGVVGAGSAAEQTRKESPTGTLTPRKTAMAVGSGVGTGIFGYVGGKVANKLGFDDADTLIANGFQRVAKKSAAGGAEVAEKGFAQNAAEVAGRIVGGGISEGAFEELPQSIQETMWQNAATGKPLTEGLDEAAVMGFLSGVAMGGPVNAFPRPNAQVATEQLQPGVVAGNGQPQPAIQDAPVDPMQQDIERAFSGPISKAADMLQRSTPGVMGKVMEPVLAPLPGDNLSGEVDAQAQQPLGVYPAVNFSQVEQAAYEDEQRRGGNPLMAKTAAQGGRGVQAARSEVKAGTQKPIMEFSGIEAVLIDGTSSILSPSVSGEYFDKDGNIVTEDLIKQWRNIGDTQWNSIAGGRSTSVEAAINQAPPEVTPQSSGEMKTVQPDLAKVSSTLQAIKEADAETLEVMAANMPAFLSENPEYKEYSQAFKQELYNRRLELQLSPAQAVASSIATNTPMNRKEAVDEGRAQGVQPDVTAQTEPLPRDIGATQPAEITGGTAEYLQGQRERRDFYRGEPAVSESDAQGFVRYQGIRRDAVGKVSEPMRRQPGESTREFIKRRKETAGNAPQDTIPSTTPALDAAMSSMDRIPPGQPVNSIRDRNIRERAAEKMRAGGELIKQAEAIEKDEATVNAKEPNKDQRPDLGQQNTTATGAKTNSTSDLPSVGTETAPSKGEASNQPGKPTDKDSLTVQPQTSTQGERDGEEERQGRQRLLNQTGASGNGAPVSGPKTSKPTTTYGASNKIFTAEAADKALATLRAKLKTQLSSGIDPELMQAGIIRAGFHIEAGARKFADYAKAMISELGDGIKPYLRSFYEGARFFPGMSDKGMSTAAEIERIDLDAIGKQADNAGKEQSQPAAETNKEATDVQANSQSVPATEQLDRTETAPGRGEGSGVSADAGAELSGTGRPDRQADDGKPTRRSDRTGKGAQHGADDRQGSVNERHGGISEQPVTTPQNYRITEADRLGKGGAKQKARDNLKAIRILKQLSQGSRTATADEQAQLVKYVGWGASELANGVFPQKKYEPASRRYVDSYKDDWKSIGEELRAALTDEEYNAAKASTINAHYTSEKIIKGMYAALERFGYAGKGKALEPGSGVGHFIGLLPDAFTAGTRFTTVEMDPISSGIAKALYPGHDVRQADFTKFKAPDNFFDIAIGNPPFADIEIVSDHDYAEKKFKLHDYFFAKSIDKVRPGGLMVLVTSRYTMDKGNDKARSYLAKRADLLGAIRLPQTAFKENAGTEVVTDVLFLRKRIDGERPAGQAWGRLEPVQAGDKKIHINEYFAFHPEMVLGKHSTAGSMYGPGQYTVDPNKGDIAEQFAQAVANLPENVYQADKSSLAPTDSQTIEAEWSPQSVKEGAFYLNSKGELLQKENGMGAPVVGMGKKKAVIKDFVRIRDAVRQVLYVQLKDEGDLAAAQQELGDAYDAFIAAHGPINKTTEVASTNKATGKESVSYRYPNFSHFKADPDAYLVAAIEKYDDATRNAAKTDIFTKRVISPPAEPRVESLVDALHVSLHQAGEVDVPLIAKMMGVDEDTAIDGLSGAIYLDPNGNRWVTADEYLSGNVRRKLAAARDAADIEPKYKANVAALEAVQPQDLPPSRIKVSLGMPIIQAEEVESFAAEVMQMGISVRHIAATGTWAVAKRSGYQTLVATNDYGTNRLDAADLIDAALNNRTVKVYDRDSDGKQVFNRDATEAAFAKLQKIRERFSQWAWEEAGRSTLLARKFNDLYNNTVKREYGGDHIKQMRFPGMSAVITPHDHQKRVAWRIVQRGNTYMAHSVGAGKTIGSIIAGMELKRLGIKKKPMWVVPNHMLKQFSSEFQQLYPAAKLLVADEEQFAKGNRNRFMGRIAAENWDGIIITHSAFGKIPVSEDYQSEFIGEQIAELEDMMADADGDRTKTKQLERQKKRLEQRLERILNNASKDKGVSFEESGIDQLFVDEAHQFRKLDFVTNQTSISGIDPNGSLMAFDLYVKTRYLETLYPGRSMVMMSGTPVTNTIGEVYTIQRFLSEPALRELDIHNFDAWAATFGESVTELVATPAGTYQPKTRFGRFRNMPSLAGMWGEIGDFVHAKDLPYLKRPMVDGGGRKMIIGQSSDIQKAYKQSLAARIKAIKERKGPPQKGDDILLTVITDGRHAALDERFIAPEANPRKDAKLEMLVDKVHGIWTESAEKRSTQMVFADLGLPQAEATRGFSVYKHIKQELMRRGVPEAEIAFMQDYKKSDEKQKLFKAMNNGDVRVLIGSSAAMGTGVNAQRKLVALHHFDPDTYLPSNIEQREGRIVRQGNENEQVQLYVYLTRGSYDETMWQFIESKQRFIDQFLAGSVTEDTVEDIDGAANQYAEARAMSSDNPLVLELAGLENDISKLESLRRAHVDGQVRMARDRSAWKSRIGTIEKLIPMVEAAAKARVDTKGERFAMTVSGKDYKGRADAGEKLIGLLKSQAARPVMVEAHDIGEIAGFTLKARSNTLDPRDMVFTLWHGKKELQGKVEDRYNKIAIENGLEKEPSPSGLVMRLENLARGVDERLEDLKDELAKAEHVIKEADNRMGAKFEQLDALEGKRARADEIRVQLELEGSEKQDATGPGEQEVKLSKSTSSITPSSSPADIGAEVAAKLGRFSTMQLMRRGVLNVVATQEEAEADIQNNGDAFRSEQTGAIQGYVKKGKVTLVADGIQSGNAYQVFLHEITHATRFGLNSNANFKRLLDTIERHKGQDTALGKAIAAAEARIPADTKPEHRTEEILAYLIEMDRTDVGIVRRFIAMVKKVLVNMGVSPDIFSKEDFKALAVNAAKWQSTMATGGNVMRSVREMFKPVDVESYNFKRWFEGSKVVDANGEPLVVYHGTNKGGFGAFKDITFATNNRDLAKSYSGEFMNPLSHKQPDIAKGEELNLKQIYSKAELEDMYGVRFRESSGGGWNANTQFGGRFYSESLDSVISDVSDDIQGQSRKRPFGYGIYSLYMNISNPMVFDAKGMNWRNLPGENTTNSIVKNAREKGHDGVIFKNILDYGGAPFDGDDSPSTVYVAFSPTQIKSAISNTGAFSPTDPRIQYSRNLFNPVDPDSPALKRWQGNSQLTEPVFHGSPKEFWTFDKNRVGKNTSSPGAGLGFFFATNRAESQGYAGPSGSLRSFYVKAENPKYMNASDLPKFKGVDEAQAYAKRQQLAGYDSIILEDEGHVIVFEPNQVKSAEINTGAFDAGNDDVRYSRASNETGPMSLENLESVATDMAAAAKRGSIKVLKPTKKDSTFLERLFSTPEYYFKKKNASGQPGASARVLQAALLRRDVRFEKQSQILGDFVTFVQALRKENKAAYEEANDYLVGIDQGGTGFKISQTEDGWAVIGPDRKKRGVYEEESGAISEMIKMEGAALRELGFSDQSIEAVKMARELTNRGFDVMAEDMRRIIAEAKENGLPDPYVSDAKIDEAGRYGIYAEGRKTPISLFASEQEAKERLAVVSELVSYAVVSRSGKMRNFNSLMKAKAWAAKRGGKVDKAKRFANLSIRKRTDKEMRPMTVREALAQMGDLRGTYFPRIRESGEYVLKARKDGENPFRQSFDLPGVGDGNLLQGVLNSITPIGRKAKELKAKGYEVTIERDTKPTDDVFDATKLITSLDAILQDSMGLVDKNDSDEVRASQHIDQILTMQIADIFKARGYLASRMQRLSGEEVWEGYETDMGKALTQYGKNIGAGTAKRDTARQMVLAFTGRDYTWKQYKEEVEDPKWDEYKAIVEERRIDPGKEKNLFKDVRGFMVDVLRNDEQADRIIGTMKGLAVHKFLGFRLSSAAVNATNMVTGVVGTMSGHTGESIARSMRRVTAAAIAYGKYRSGMGDVSDADRNLFQEITRRGWDEAQFDQEAMSELRSKAGEMWNKYATWSMFMFGAVEKANRAMTLFAAYKGVAAKNPKMEAEDVWEAAKEISDRAHGVYGKETMPAIARGGELNRALRLPLTFTKFTHNYMLNILDLGFSKKEYKAAAYLLLSPALIAGSGATVAAPVVFALAGALGIGGDDPEEAFYDWMADSFGSDAFARHGLSGLAGINIKGSLQVNLPMPADIAKINAASLAGPVGGIVSDAFKGVTSLAKGDISKGVEVLLPTAFGSMLKSVRESSEGITTSNYGSVFYGDEPLKADTVDAVLRFFSFNPSRISGIREKQWNEKEVAAKYQEKRTKINNAIKRDYLQGKPALNPERMKEIKRYNELVKGSGRRDISPMTVASIRVMLKRASRPGKRERLRAAETM